MRVLDLFCGAGGAAMGLHRAWPDAEIVGVDIAPQPRYPFTFVQEDVLFIELLGPAWMKGFDFIWASPPCQFHCALKTMLNRREHKDLIPETRKLLLEAGRPYAIENVFGAPLVQPLMLCGSHFGLESNGFQLRRHRYFEASFPLGLRPACNHKRKTLGVYGSKVRDIAQEKRHYAKEKTTRGEPDGVVLPQRWGFEAMGVDWMNIDELSEAIPPAYSEYIARKFEEPELGDGLGVWRHHL